MKYCADRIKLPFCPSVVFLILATYWGLGAHDSQVPDGMLIYYQVRVKNYMFCFELIYFASSVLTKLAMAIMILRLSSTKTYAYIIWGNMAVLGVTATVCLVVMFASCTPIPALWNEKLYFTASRCSPLSSGTPHSFPFSFPSPTRKLF